MTEPPTFEEQAPVLESLKVGALSLSPAFDASVTEYTATTTNASNTVTARAADGVDIVIELNGVVLDGTSCKWVSGENVLKVVARQGGRETQYTVKVTK